MASEPSGDNEIVSYLIMRKTIGWLGIGLPFLLLAGNFLINNIGLFTSKAFVQVHDGYLYKNEGSFKSSVSHYYYTTVGEIFTGTLCAVALFLICYTGHPKRKNEKGLSDNAMSNIAGILALGVVAFPTSSDVIMRDNLRSFISSEFIGWVHYGFAGLFFITLALMSMVNFRRKKNQQKFGEGPDDSFYLGCGLLILGCIVLVYPLSKISWLNEIHITFILEAIMLTAFGLSWLKKGQADFTYLPKKLGIGNQQQSPAEPPV